MEELIANRYAKALSSVSKNIADVAAILTVLSEAIEISEVKKALLSPIVSNNDKTEMILATLGDNKDSTLINFIKILGENGRLELIPAIARVLNTELQKVSNSYEGILHSKENLDAKALGDLEETLKKYTGSTITLKQEISDVDGLHVSVDDLGIEVNFSKQKVKEQLIDFIKKSL